MCYLSRSSRDESHPEQQLQGRDCAESNFGPASISRVVGLQNGLCSNLSPGSDREPVLLCQRRHQPQHALGRLPLLFAIRLGTTWQLKPLLQLVHSADDGHFFFCVCRPQPSHCRRLCGRSPASEHSVRPKLCQWHSSASLIRSSRSTTCHLYHYIGRPMHRVCHSRLDFIDGSSPCSGII